MKTCKRCGADWQERVNDPRYCPLCKSPYWNKGRVRNAGIRDGVGRVDRGGGQDNRADDGANGKGIQKGAGDRGSDVAGSGSRPAHASGCKCLMCKGRV